MSGLRRLSVAALLLACGALAAAAEAPVPTGELAGGSIGWSPGFVEIISGLSCPRMRPRLAF